MPFRSKSITLVAAAAGAIAMTAVAAPATASPSRPTGKAGPSCSTETWQAAGGYHKPNLVFTYDLTGPSCRDAVYTLIVRNIYNDRQWAFYAQHGDGSSAISIDKRLPFTPTDPADAGDFQGTGLCVTAVVLRHGRIVYVAPSDEPCLLLGHDGGARAFH